eukprot:TRINITY_DN3485_c0_g10_i1.p1 TRINITY_DN3485_c0_g10~~TRINITY_DN3485_c0_g10_i1.p1  ORF type:complete len:1093 (-),score=141.56 TRINITY_DN3485_c0_g10_i1:124-3402(-)
MPWRYLLLLANSLFLVTTAIRESSIDLDLEDARERPSLAFENRLQELHAEGRHDGHAVGHASESGVTSFEVLGSAHMRWNKRRHHGDSHLDSLSQGSNSFAESKERSSLTRSQAHEPHETVKTTKTSLAQKDHGDQGDVKAVGTPSGTKNETAITNGTKNESVADVEEVSVPGLLWQDFQNRNAQLLQMHLGNLSKMLLKDSSSFGVNLALKRQVVSLNFSHAVKDSAKNVSKTEANGGNDKTAVTLENLTMVALAVEARWFEGLEILLEWDASRRDASERIDLDVSGEATSTPLLLALKAGEFKSVGLLVERNASLFLADSSGRTPLEAAVEMGSHNMTRQLLTVNNSALAHCLLVMQTKLAKESQNLPKLTEWWPLASGDKSDGMEKMRNSMPLSLQPQGDDLSIVGEVPKDWVLLYANRVMYAYYQHQGPHHSTSRSNHSLGSLLSEHGFDNFALNYTITTVLICALFGLIFVLVHTAFRIRVFGSAKAPMSLAECIPGAFDPSRLTDPDFDPSRQKTKLPYKSVQEFVSHAATCSVDRPGFATKALLGVYSSWLFQAVRIPPEKDTFDEEYLSDDDEESRLKVRDSCASRAKRVKTAEVVVRSLLLTLLLWWLIRITGRREDAFVLVIVYLFQAYVASSVAAATHPVEPSSSKDSYSAEDVDSARVVTDLFGIQVGPRWTRAICTTRSTAAPSKGRLARRSRLRRPRQSASQAASGPDSSGTEPTAASAPSEVDESLGSSSANNGDTGATAATSTGTSTVQAPSEIPFSEKFQTMFLNSDTLHVSHGNFLCLNVGSFVTCFLAVIWLQHCRRLFTGDWSIFYETITPPDLFLVYGGPGTSDRWLAISGEFLLLWLCVERLQEVCSLLHVATLTQMQRKAALSFLSENQPRPLNLKHREENGAKDTTLRIEEVVRCTEFALELSDARWALLRGPVMAAYVWTILLFLASIILLLLPLVKISVVESRLDPIAASLDGAAFVLLVVGQCVMWPLAVALFEANSANAQVRLQQAQIRNEAEIALTVSPIGREDHDVQYVELRSKANEALEGQTLTWHSGRELSCFEPLLVLVLGGIAAGLALARSYLLTDTS